MDKARLEEIFQAVEDAVARRGQEIIRSHVKLTRDLDAAVEQIETLRVSCKRLNARNYKLESELIEIKDKLRMDPPRSQDMEMSLGLENKRLREQLLALQTTRDNIDLKGWDATRDRLVADLTIGDPDAG